MLLDTTSDDTVTEDIHAATIFKSEQTAYNRARARGWRIWTSWREDGSEYVSRADCPKDIK
jgi:hypothetical protein